MAVRNQLVHCELCGEDYAATYRRCPFCDGTGDNDWDEPMDEFDSSNETRRSSTQSRANGGRRAATNARGGGYGGRSILRAVSFILSLALIIAAAWIVLFVVVPKLMPPSVVTPPVTDTTPPVNTISPNPTTPAPETTPLETGGDANAADPADTTPAETETETTPPTSGAALTLNREEFTLSNAYPSFHMTATGGTGSVTWSISGSLATVSDTGLVTAVSGTKAGEYCVVTATDEAGATATCIVRVDSAFRANGDSSPAASQNTAAKLSHTDVTLNRTYGLSFTLSVKGGDGAVTFSSSNTAIATVTEGGVVKGVGSGTCSIRATLADGTVLTCRVIVQV